MPKAPTEPTNLVLEQLRLMRGEAEAFRAETNHRFDKLDGDVAGLKKDVRGMKLQAIAEVYKANLTVASFADPSARLSAVEGKLSTR